MHPSNSFLSAVNGLILLVSSFSQLTQAQTFTTFTSTSTSTSTSSSPITSSKGQTTLISIPVLETSLPPEIGIYGSIIRGDAREAIYKLACLEDTQIDHTDEDGKLKPVDYCSWLWGSLTVQVQAESTLSEGGGGGGGGLLYTKDMTSWMVYDNTHRHAVITKTLDGPEVVVEGVTTAKATCTFSPNPHASNLQVTTCNGTISLAYGYKRVFNTTFTVTDSTSTRHETLVRTMRAPDLERETELVAVTVTAGWENLLPAATSTSGASSEVMNTTISEGGGGSPIVMRARATEGAMMAVVVGVAGVVGGVAVLL